MAASTPDQQVQCVHEVRDDSSREERYEVRDDSSREERYVHEVYDEIAAHFSQTRHSPWPGVQRFLATATGSVVDVGCGNGKYLVPDASHPPLLLIGCDRSIGLLLQARYQTPWPLVQCDNLSLPFRNSAFVCAAAARWQSQPHDRHNDGEG
jgi:SAM-dependent methyltransferase